MHRRTGRPAAAATVAVLCGVLGLGACGADRPGAPEVPGAVPTAATSPRAPSPAPAPTTRAPAPTAAPRTAAPQSAAPATPAPTATTTAPEPCAEPGGCFSSPTHAGAFDATLVAGASGLAASRRNPGLLWLLDDRRGTSEVWVMTAAGALLGAVTVEGLDAADTEALAVGPCGPAAVESCVYVGDIGDNRRGREHVAIHRFAEPDLAAGLPGGPVAAAVARLRYPDGPHDAEALLVDDGGVPLIVTKAPFDRATATTGTTHLYRAPGFADGTLEDLGEVPVPAPARPLHSLAVGSVVTGADHRDGRVLLRTYDQVLLYVAEDPAAGPEGFAAWPVRAVPAPLERQSEAIAWTAPDDPAGCGYRTVGEQAGDLWFVACRP